MNQSSDQHHIQPGVVARPADARDRRARDLAVASRQRSRAVAGTKEKIADLVRQLGLPAASAGEIDERLRSFGPFPRTSRRAALSLTVS